MSKKVLVLMGGLSAEREVSLSSGQDICNALESKGYHVVAHDFTDVWKLIDVLKKEKPDVVFNGLYGNWGEDGEIQGMLDLMQIPYTHSGLKASAIGMDKYITKMVAKSCGIRVAPSQKMKARNFFENGTVISMPFVVKPVCDGSSVGVFIVNNQEDLLKVKYKDLDREILVEKYIPGQELTVMCLEDKAYVVTELKASDEFYDYKAKYTDGVTQHILPAEVPYEVSEICKAYAEKLHQRLGCNTVSRVDLRYNPEDGVVLLEINTNPGMTALSLVPEQAKYAGISYEELCAKLVENASCRKI
ncbi:MAG: D-alanine--D-alanine ligase [Proteobacteria bacterium]|nr:D-alanine--D-alanine ligase [Pseudomonadota bacterium]